MPEPAAPIAMNQPPLTRPGLGPIALALGVGAIGGALFSALNVPLAWMLGAMIFNIAASVYGWPVLIPHRMRIAFVCVVGVFLGGAFGPDMMDRIRSWAVSLSLVLLFVPLITFVAFLYYRLVAKFERATAVFCGAPGALSAATIIGGEWGADERLIALTQGMRVVLVVILLPQIVMYLITSTPHLAPDAAADAPFVAMDALLLAGAAGVGFLASIVFGAPALALTVAMVATAALYLTGTVSYHPPEAIQNIAFWVLGSSIGSRFSTVSPATFFRVSKHGVAATALIVAVSALYALMVSRLAGTPFLATLISFTPGGIPEMSLIAIAFDIDPAFVAVHHLVRIGFLIVAMPIAGRMLFGAGK